MKKSIMATVKELQKTAYETLKSEQGYSNPMQTPQVEKVVLSVGTGSLNDARKEELIQDRLAKITGQKPAPRGARKSIASFKIREGHIIGYQVTLRGKRMHDFLEKFNHVVLPRTRDFRGISPSSIDEMGNLTIGLREHTVFPETSDEEMRDVFGLAVTITTTARSSEEARAYLAHLGVPFAEQ
jgi:large subunit ribosomal protein L5